MTRRLAGFAVYSNIFLVMLGLGVIGPNLTDMRRDFSVSYGAISWGISAFAFARLLTNLPAGVAAGRWPRLPLLFVGTLCVAAGSLLAAAADGLALFIVGRAVSGVGSSIATTVGLTIVLDGAASTHRGRASGLFHSALGGGALFGPGFGAVLASAWGWRAALLGAAGAATLSLALLVVAFRGATGTPGLGAPGGEPGDAATTRLSPWSLVFGVALGAYVAAFAIFFVRGGVQQTVIPLMGRDVVGFSALALAILLMASAGLSSLLGPFAGALSDRVGRARVLLPGLGALAIGVALLACSSHAVLFVVGVFLTSVAGTTFSIPASMIVDEVGSAQRAWAIGVYRVAGDSAFTMAPFISGVLIDRQGFAAAGLFSAGIVTAAIVAAGWHLTRARVAAGLPYRASPSEDSAAT